MAFPLPSYRDRGEMIARIDLHQRACTMMCPFQSHGILRIVSISLTSLGLLAGCNKSAEAPKEEPPPAPVKVASVEEKELAEWTPMLGSPQPLPHQSARITAAVEGKVLQILQDEKGKMLAEGQKIDKNQMVVQLDDRVAQANRAKVQAAQDEMKEQLVQAELAVDLARVDVNRLNRLLPSGRKEGDLPLVSQIELEKARIAFKDAESKHRGVEARLKASKAELNALDEQLALYKLRAPISGRLGMVQVVLGQNVAIGTLVAEVVDLEEIDILCYLPPNLRSRLKEENQIVKLAEEDKAEGAKNPEGKVVFIALQAQPETGNFAVKLRFSNPGTKLLGNTVVRVLVQTQPEKKRKTITHEALMEDTDPPGVVVVKKIEKEDLEGKKKIIDGAKKLQAIVGIRSLDGTTVEILGLKDPEKPEEKIDLKEAVFVTEGGYGLKDDDEVKIEEEKKEEKPVEKKDEKKEGKPDEKKDEK
jgi:RND family efflux transporter MFP subunit